MKSYYFEEGIISEKMGCGAECTSSIIRNLNEADYIIKKAFKEINSHDKLSKVSFVSCSNKVGEIQCMYDNYIQSRDLYCEYGNDVDKNFTKEQEKVCDSLGDLNINKITVGDNLGVYDYQRPDSVKTLNLSVLLSYGDIDKALREDYEKQVKNIEYLRELVKLDDSEWPPEYTAEQVKAIKDYVKYLDDNEIKFDTYEKERQKFLESDDLNFITKGEERLSLILDFIPGVGLIKGGYETIVGVDPVTKRKLSGVERGITGFACLLDAKGLYKIGKTAFKVSVKDGAKFGSKYLAKEFSKDTIGGYGFYAATQAADKAGIGPKGQLAIIGGLLAYGNRKKIAGTLFKNDEAFNNAIKNSFLDNMRINNKAEYKNLMKNISDAQKGEIYRIFKSKDKIKIAEFNRLCKEASTDVSRIQKYLNTNNGKKVLIDNKQVYKSVKDETKKKLDEYLKIASDPKNTTLSKKQLRPAFSVSYNKNTGKYYYARNLTKQEVKLETIVYHPYIKQRIDNMSKEVFDSYEKTIKAGSHAECLSLNESMLDEFCIVNKIDRKTLTQEKIDELYKSSVEMFNQNPGDTTINVVNSYKLNSGEFSQTGVAMPRCPHCKYVTNYADMVPDVIESEVEYYKKYYPNLKFDE